MRSIYGILSVFFLALFIGQTPVQAEQVALDAPVFAGVEHQFTSDVFRVISAASGQMTTTPGAVFTDGSDEGMSLPYLASRPTSLTYPSWAVEKGWQGDLVIAVEVLPDGSVGQYQVMQSTGYEALDQSAAEAVRSWTFSPASKDGQSVTTCVQIPIRFELKL
ncbi:MAG: energy transducer TonB [Candidatus Omnitrophota bacterium]|nr:energy transducer TonB [Candidatus Omnitrophota bacterium]